MEWVRNHIILKAKNFEYGIRGNEKSVKFVVGVKIALQAKRKSKKEQGSPAWVSKGALYEHFRDFKWLYISLK